MAHHSITSARNGLKIAIPMRPYGVLARFGSKGDNELIFKNPRRAEVGAEAKAAAKQPVKAAAEVEASQVEEQASERVPRRKRKKAEDQASSNEAAVSSGEEMA